VTAALLRLWRPAALVLLVLAVVGAVAGLGDLRRQAAADRRGARVLGEARETANDLRLIEWHALAGVQSPDRAALEFSASADAFVRLLRGPQGKQPLVVAVNQRFAAYAGLVVREFKLLRDARVAAAHAHHALNVDAAASLLTTSLENAEETFTNRASWKTDVADIGTLGVLAAAAGFALVLWRRFRLARGRAAQGAVERSERRLRALVQHSYDVVGIIGPDGRIAWASESALRVFGVPASELVGTEFLSLVHPDDAEHALLRYSQLVAGEDVSPRDELRTRHADGGWRQLELSISNRLLDPDVGGIVVNVRDVTELRRNEEELRQAQKLGAVGRLAGGVAHDFNNLLTVMIGNADLALDRLQDGDANRQELEEIRAAAGRAAELTRQLLAFGRKQVLQPEIFQLDGVVTGIGLLLRRLIGADVELVIRPGAAGAHVLADRGQLEQVIVNLAVNARDAMPDGGTLTIETTLRDDAHVALAVRDTGVGMDEETRSRVFEPFFTTKHDGRGTGLGLATVDGIVAQSGGRILVESEPGRGASFTVLLPLAAAQVGEAPSAPERAAPVVDGRPTVLVADDEALVRGLIVDGLERAGYDVLAAADGREALELARVRLEPIDLLVTDIVMPGMSGRDLAEQLVAERPELKILFVSGYPGGAPGDEAAAPGPRFLQKPFTLGELAAAVAEAIAADKLVA
jgi:PAS domain S-box-containing protein